MDKDNSDILSMSEDEFTELLKDEKNHSAFRRILLYGISEMRREIERTEKYLDSFTTRGAITLALVQLFSLVLLSIPNNPDFIKYYLMWILPYFILAGIFFVISMSRIGVCRTGFRTGSTPEQELLMLRCQALADLDSWRKISGSYGRTIVFHRLTNIFTYLFLISFLVNYYLFTFSSLPDLLSEKMFYSLIFWLFGMWLYVDYLKKSGFTNYGRAK